MGAASRCVRVEVHGEDAQGGLFVLESPDYPDKVWDRPCQAIQFRDDKSVALANEFESLLELVPILNRGDLLDEKLLDAGRLQLRHLIPKPAF